MIRTRELASIVATLTIGSTAVHAGPCTAEIARLEREVRAAQANPEAGPAAPQSLAADLEHQPTPETVAAAKKRAQAGFETVLARAKELDSRGDPACFDAVTDARLIYFQ